MLYRCGFNAIILGYRKAFLNHIVIERVIMLIKNNDVIPTVKKFSG